MRSKRYIILLVMPGLLLIMMGCFQMIGEQREPLPVISWPKAPENPKIHFVNSFTIPEDLDIRDGALRKLVDFFKGKEETSIIKPYGVETDSEGRYYVVDNFNKYVHVFDGNNKSYYIFPDEDIPLESPIDIAIDKNGALFISDSKEGVIKYFGNYGKKYIGEIGRGLLKRPTGIAINSTTNELLVVDTLDSRILRFDIESQKLKGTIGESGSEEGMFHYPTNIFVSGDGRIFVSDSLNFRIQIFSSEGQFLNAFGQVGNNPGFFARPTGVAVDSDSNIYVVDALFDTVQIFNSEGRLLMDFGGPGHNYGEFWLPSGIYIDSHDRIYVSDTYNKRIQIFEYIKGVD